MSREWENTFSSWAQAPSKTENERIERTVKSIRNALNADDFLSSRSMVYVQGSYRNRVNVRQDSDVDIGIQSDGVRVNLLRSHHGRHSTHTGIHQYIDRKAMRLGSIPLTHPCESDMKLEGNSPEIHRASLQENDLPMTSTS